MKKDLNLYMKDIANNFEYGKILAFVLEIESRFEAIIEELKKIEEKNIVNYDLKQNIEDNYSGINDTRKIMYSILFEELLSHNSANNTEKGTLAFTDDKVQN